MWSKKECEVFAFDAFVSERISILHVCVNKYVLEGIPRSRTMGKNQSANFCCAKTSVQSVLFQRSRRKMSQDVV